MGTIDCLVGIFQLELTSMELYIAIIILQTAVSVHNHHSQNDPKRQKLKKKDRFHDEL